LSFWSESKLEIFGSNRYVFARTDLRMCFFHHEAWRRWCYGVGLLCWWHGHSILQRYAIPSGLGLVGLSFCFNRTMTQHNSRLFKGYFNNTESDWVLHQMTWLPQSPDLNQIEMVWDELDRRVKGKQPTSAHHMWELKSWKSIPGEAGWANAKCAKLSKQRMAIWNIYLDFNTLVATWFHVLHSFVFAIILLHRKNKEPFAWVGVLTLLTGRVYPL
jgi:hypothetical protein